MMKRNNNNNKENDNNNYNDNCNDHGNNTDNGSNNNNNNNNTAKTHITICWKKFVRIENTPAQITTTKNTHTTTTLG